MESFEIVKRVAYVNGMLHGGTADDDAGLRPPALVLLFVLSRLCRRRQVAGHRPPCGYDLRAWPERCPECGKPGCRDASPSDTVRPHDGRSVSDPPHE